MMFACAMYPNGDFLKSVRVEINQQIRRIQHHASIALFAGNNENEAALKQNWYGTNGNYSAFAKVCILRFALGQNLIFFIPGIQRTLHRHNRRRNS
jgi:hypothetical protein